MNFIVEFDPRAEDEYLGAIEWYGGRSEGLGERFVKCVNAQISRIAKNPLIYESKKYDTRECKVEDFPYLVVYKLYPEKSVIYITSIFHTSRNPKKKYRKY